MLIEFFCTPTCSIMELVKASCCGCHIVFLCIESIKKTRVQWCQLLSFSRSYIFLLPFIKWVGESILHIVIQLFHPRLKNFVLMVVEGSDGVQKSKICLFWNRLQLATAVLNAHRKNVFLKYLFNREKKCKHSLCSNCCYFNNETISNGISLA